MRNMLSELLRKVSYLGTGGHKVGVVSASSRISQPLAFLLKFNPTVTELSLFDVVRTPGVASDVSPNCTSLTKKPGMTRDDLFNTNGIGRAITEACAKSCPDAMLLAMKERMRTIAVMASIVPIPSPEAITVVADSLATLAQQPVTLGSALVTLTTLCTLDYLRLQLQAPQKGVASTTERDLHHARSFQLQTALTRLQTPFAPAAPVKILFPRPLTQAGIDTYLSVDPGFYLVVYGPRGSGKSTLLQHTLNKCDGVVYLCVEEKSAQTDLHKEVLRSLGVDAALSAVGTPSTFLLELFRAYAECNQSKLPVIALSTGTDNPAFTRTIGKMLKFYCEDNKVARAVLDLSNFEVVREMQTDHRALFVPMQEIDLPAAVELLASYSDHLLAAGLTPKTVWESVGGKPAQLTKICRAPNPQAFVASIRKEARQQIDQYLLQHPQHRAALAALSTASYYHGLTEQVFNAKVEEAGGRWHDLDDLPDAFAEGKVLQFRYETQAITFRSFAHYAMVQEAVSPPNNA